MVLDSFFIVMRMMNHVHVIKGSAKGKIWLEPEVLIAYLHGFSSREESFIMQIVSGHTENFKQKWNEYFA
jgi:hypothetical protein